MREVEVVPGGPGVQRPGAGLAGDCASCPRGPEAQCRAGRARLFFGVEGDHGESVAAVLVAKLRPTSLHRTCAYLPAICRVRTQERSAQGARLEHTCAELSQL